VALTVALAAGCGLSIPVIQNWSARAPVGAAGLAAIAVLFVIGESVVIHVPIKRDTHTTSFSEVPLTLGLIILSPLGLGAAAMGGSLLAIARRPGQRGVKFAFNAAQVGVQCVVSVLVFHFLSGTSGLGAARTSAAAAAGVLAADIASALLVSLAIGLFRGRWPSLGIVELTGGLISTVAKVAVGLLAVAAVVDNSAAELVMVGIAAMTMYLAFRAFARLHERHSRLEMLYRFARSVGQSLQLDDVARAIVLEARDILRSDTAELVLRLASNRISTWRSCPDGSVSIVESSNVDSAMWDVVVEGKSPISTDRTLAYGVTLHSRASGYLCVRDRVGVDGSFDAVDAQLFSALVDQAAIALENGELVEQLEAEMREREHRAAHDPLTGLLNRAAFTDVLDDALAAEHARRALFVIGLDRFSRVNEVLGHDTGDVVLAALADRLRRIVDGTAVARVGGDVFALLTPSSDDRDHRGLLEQVRLELRRGVSVEGLALEFEASIGVALFPEHAHTGGVLLQFADTAMRHAKTRHTSEEVYEGGDANESRRRLTLAQELRRAIDQRALVVYYQPQIDINSGCVTGVEALVRWPQTQHRVLMPDQFVPIAEHTGLIEGLTALVLDESLLQRQRWAAEGIELTTAVNVSVRSLTDRSFANQVTRALVHHRCPAEALTIEITESQLMADLDSAARVLGELHDLGVRISIDDFGTGFSSLWSLRSLPLHEVKIDKSFVQGIATNESDATIVRSITALGSNLGLHVVAEGVDDDATVQFLAACGAHTLQGFHFARPLPPELFERWLTDRSAERLLAAD
jgi:diguanylate cyclase (GGDEF)-like protein